MCGIAGIWQLDGRKVERHTVERFVGALAHRGPDGEGILINDDGRLALAHRRLAILDLSAAGDQPMRSASGQYDITYNGEVYNFLELEVRVEGPRRWRWWNTLEHLVSVPADLATQVEDLGKSAHAGI